MAGQKTIWSVGGGKGGIGKSVTTANIGCALAQRGKDVVLVDADLGGANLHTYFGIKYPQKTLEDFLKGRVQKLEDAAIETPLKGLRLISGGGEFLGIANPAYFQKQKMLTAIHKLEADHILVDLGAGSTYNVLDFFALSREGIVILAPEPAAIQNAYIFLKTFVYRRLARLFPDEPISGIIHEATDVHSKNSVRTFSDLCGRIAAIGRDAAEKALLEIKSYRPKVILNMAASKDDIRVADVFKSATGAFLGLETEFMGVIYNRASIKAAARKMRPFMLDETAVDARRDMEVVVSNLLKESAAGSEPKVDKYEPVKPLKREPREKKEEHEVLGFNDNVNHMGVVFHVQTEAQGGGSPLIETIIYQGGRIFFSKKTRWDDVPKESGGKDQSLRDYAARQHKTAILAIKMNKITLQD